MTLVTPSTIHNKDKETESIAFRKQLYEEFCTTTNNNENSANNDNNNNNNNNNNININEKYNGTFTEAVDKIPEIDYETLSRMLYSNCSESNENTNLMRGAIRVARHAYECKTEWEEKPEINGRAVMVIVDDAVNAEIENEIAENRVDDLNIDNDTTNDDTFTHVQSSTGKSKRNNNKNSYKLKISKSSKQEKEKPTLSLLKRKDWNDEKKINQMEKDTG